MQKLHLELDNLAPFGACPARSFLFRTESLGGTHYFDRRRLVESHIIKFLFLDFM